MATQVDVVASGCRRVVAAIGCTHYVLDHQLSQSIRLGDVPGDLRKAIELSEAFAHGSGATAILLALLLASRPPRRDYWMAVTMTAASGIVANVAKAFLRERGPTHLMRPGRLNLQM